LLRHGTLNGDRRRRGIGATEKVSPLRRRMTTSSVRDSRKTSASFCRASEYM
jgi:hypothetical protein